jgi:hypothetical protein
MGALLFGADEISGTDPNLPIRIWKPLLGPPLIKHSPGDTWGMIASAARMANDSGYARLASNLSVSLRAASLQLRNASDEYYKQLRSALVSERKPNLRFSNIPMIDLHLAFHSVSTEIASARDYLAQVAARRVNAPDNIDALSRLGRWLEKPPNAASRNDDLITRLLAASDGSAPDPWLADITEHRNLFLRRDHIGAMAKWLCLEERETALGPVRTIKMARSASHSPLAFRPTAPKGRAAPHWREWVSSCCPRSRCRRTSSPAVSCACCWATPHPSGR